MNLLEPDLVRFLTTLLLLLGASTLLGSLFQRFQQPRVIGEITGGLLFGPMLLGTFAPSAYSALFDASPSGKTLLAGTFWLGQMLLMFCAGLESHAFLKQAHWKTVGALTLAGVAAPLALGWAWASHADLGAFMGPRATPDAFGLMVGILVAVTAIPVLSKILLDLGLGATAFARTVLSVAFIEDLALWILLSLTLSLAGHEPKTAWQLTLGVANTVGFFAACTLLGHRLLDASARWNLRLPPEAAASARQLAALAAVLLLAFALGVNPIFGAFLAGHIVSKAQSIPSESKRQLRGLAVGFFVPLFFAGVGLKLDLRHDFNLAAFAAFLAFAFAVKTVSAFLGGLIAGQGKAQSLHLAVALNARGVVGIIVATAALEAGLITPGFFSIAVLTALLSSQIAGWWLQLIQRRAPAQLLLAGEGAASRTVPASHPSPQPAVAGGVSGHEPL